MHLRGYEMAWATVASADVLQTFGLLIFDFLLFCWLVIHLSYQGTLDIDVLHSLDFSP